jgi:four helix bundle protein
LCGRISWDALHVYNATRGFPKEELYGLTSQVRRSAASIGANIAEGSGRRSNNEIGRFLQIARGSASETEYHLLLAHDLDVLRDEDFRELSRQADELQRMLTALIQSFHREEREASYAEGYPLRAESGFAHRSQLIAHSFLPVTCSPLDIRASFKKRPKQKLRFHCQKV